MQFETIATGLQFPEGPIALADGSTLVVEIRRQTLTHIAADGEISIVADLGGGPNGAAIGPDGRVYVCNNGGFAWVDLGNGVIAPHGKADDYAGGSIQVVDLASGGVQTLYAACDGRSLSAPNDIVFDSHGGFWFTDLGKDHETGHDYGAIYYATIDGGSISRQRDKVSWPNGCGLSPDGKTLYVSETWTSRLWAFEVSEPGVLAPPQTPFLQGRLVVTLPDYEPFDSLAVQANGDICVATCINGGISVISPAGDVRHVPVPDFVTTNICFGGADMRDAWITGSSTGTVFKTRWDAPGLKLAFGA